MYEQRAQVSVTAFADTQQLDPPAGPRLARYQAEIGGELARRAELLRIRHAGDDRGGSEQTDAGNGHDALTLRRGALPAGELLLECDDARSRIA